MGDTTPATRRRRTAPNAPEELMDGATPNTSAGRPHHAVGTPAQQPGAALHGYRLGLRRPLATGSGPLTERRGLLLALRDRDGLCGWGEAAPLRGWPGPDLAATAAALVGALADLLPDNDPDGLDDLGVLLERAATRLSEAPCAWAALGGAAADLAARRQGVPLATSLGSARPPVAATDSATPTDSVAPAAPFVSADPPSPAPDTQAAAATPLPTALGSGRLFLARGASGPAAATPLPTALGSSVPPSAAPRVPTAALVDGDTPEALASRAAAAQGDGFGTLKVKVGARPLAEDVARLAALREAAPRARLRLDANGAWGPQAAAAALEAIAPFEPEYVEEPCHGLSELRRLQAVVAVPLAVDESLPPLAALHRHLPLGVAVAVLKPSALGAPTAVLRAARALRDSGTEIVIGSFLESAVGLTTAAHVALVAAATGGSVAGLDTSALFADDVCTPPPVTGGALRLPDGPGLGLSPDPARLTPYPPS